MSDFFEKVRSAGVIGIFLGILVLGAFGALFLAVFDDRLNGENATRLKENVREQTFELSQLKDSIAAGEENIIYQKQNKVVLEKLEGVTKTLDVLIEKEKSLSAEIESEKKKIVEISDAQLVYRDEYRLFIRQKAIGESFEELNLKNGKTLKDAKIREILPDRVRFTTEFGSSSATWDELPAAWLERFQIGSGEQEEHKEMTAELAKQRMEVAAAAQENRGEYLRELELRKSLEHLKKQLASKTNLRDGGKQKALLKRAEATRYHSKADATGLEGNKNSFTKTAKKAESEVKNIERGVRVVEGQIRDLKKKISLTERDLKKLKR